MATRKQIEKQMETEMRKQIDIYYSAVALALHRQEKDPWGQKRILKLWDETQAAWNECAEYKDQKSMIQMLNEETGIELQIGDGKSWRDLAFLNPDHPMNKRPVTEKEMYYMRLQQMKWIGTQVLACILLGMYRRYEFGAERTQRLHATINDIGESYCWNQSKLRQACIEETGLDVRHKYFGRGDKE